MVSYNERVRRATCIWARCRYTGEDGFELSIPNTGVLQVTRELTSNENVRMAGLGARDSLRLEAGLCLYGAPQPPRPPSARATRCHGTARLHNNSDAQGTCVAGSTVAV